MNSNFSSLVFHSRNFKSSFAKKLISAVQNMVVVLLLGLFFFNKINFAQEKILNKDYLNWRIMDVNESENHISVIHYSQGNFIAVLYKNDGNEVIKVNAKEYRSIRFAEYIPLKGLYLVAFAGGESYEESKTIPGEIIAVNINDGKIIWAVNSDAINFEVSPDCKYIISKISESLDADTWSEFEIFDLEDGTKVSFPKRLNEFRATWLAKDSVLIAFNETQKMKPLYLIDQQLAWENDWSKQLGKKYVDYKNGILTKKEYDEYEDKAIGEKHRKLNEFANRIYRETKELITSKLLLFNVGSKKIEFEKAISEKGSGNFLLNLQDYETLNTDKEQNIYLMGYLKDGRIEQNIHSFIKYDKYLNLIWKSPLLPLTLFTKYYLNKKPYYGFFKNNKESFVEPVSGSVVSYESVKKSFPDIPHITFLREKTSSYKTLNTTKIDWEKNTVILVK